MLINSQSPSFFKNITEEKTIKANGLKMILIVFANILTMKNIQTMNYNYLLRILLHTLKKYIIYNALMCLTMLKNQVGLDLVLQENLKRSNYTKILVK